LSCKTHRARAVVSTPDKLWASITQSWRIETVLGGGTARTDVTRGYSTFSNMGA